MVDESGETLTLGFGTPPEGVTVGATSETVVRFGDDDSRGILLIPDELAVTEGGGAATYTVQLTSQPTSGVTLTVAVEQPVIGGTDLPVSVSPSRLSFNASNWDSEQTVRVTAVPTTVMRTTKRPRSLTLPAAETMRASRKASR